MEDNFVPTRKLMESPEPEFVPTRKVHERNTWTRAGYQTLGGMVGGAVGTAGGPVGSAFGIGLGSGIGGQVYDIYEEYMGRKEPEPLAQRSVGAATDVMFDVVSPVALSKGIYAAKKMGGYLINKPVSKLFRPAEMAAYKSVGVKPTAATATQSKAIGVAEHALADFPFSAGPLQKSAQYNVEQLKFANEYLAKEFGEVLTKEEAGVLLKKGAPAAIESLEGTYEKLFGLVSKRIGNKPQAIEHTKAMLTKLFKEAETGPSSGVAAIAEDLIEKAQKQGGGLPFEGLKKFRSKIGKMMKEPGLVSNKDIVSGDLKRLYAALSQDMEVAAKGAGPKAHANWRAANKYFESSLRTKVPILEEIIKKNYDQEALDLVMRGSKQGGQRLGRLRKQLNPKEWDAVAGTVFHNLGKATPGAQNAAGEMFSVKTFMTRWNQLAPEAKKALWGGTRYKHLARDLDDFVKVAGDFKAVEDLANRSRTGSVLMFFSLFQTLGAISGGVAAGATGAVGGMAAMGSMAITPYAAARLLTNSGFVRWLSKGVKIAAANPNAMSTHLGRLFAIKEKGNVSDEINELIMKTFE